MVWELWGWGVGGIEAEAAMLGQPVYFLTPDVVGVHMTGSLREELPLRISCSELPRCAEGEVVGKFVEFHGDGAASLSVTDRATIAICRLSMAQLWASFG